MKRVTGFYVLAALALATSVVSCKKETISPALPSENGADRETPMTIISQPLETYPLLTQHGNVSLTYYANGKLKSVNRGDGNTMSYIYPDQFPNIIMAEEKSNGVKTGSYNYFLDGNGRCIKMTAKKVQFNLEYEYVFTYNSGKLVEQKATKGFSDKYTFHYDAQNRLQEVYWYKSNGEIIDHSFIAYHNASTPSKTDKYPLNPRDSWMDTYLPIFGKFSKDLMVYYVEYKGAGNANWQRWSNFYYTLDGSGFVTNRKEELHEVGKPFNGTISADYKYNTQRGM